MGEREEKIRLKADKELKEHLLSLMLSEDLRKVATYIMLGDKVEKKETKSTNNKI